MLYLRMGLKTECDALSYSVDGLKTVVVSVWTAGILALWYILASTPDPMTPPAYPQACFLPKVFLA